MKLLVVSFVYLVVSRADRPGSKQSAQNKDRSLDQTIETFNLDRESMNETISDIDNCYNVLLNVLLGIIDQLDQKIDPGFQLKLMERVQQAIKDAKSPEASQRMYKSSRSVSYAECLQQELYLNTVLIHLAQTCRTLTMYYGNLLWELTEVSVKETVKPNSDDDENSNDENSKDKPDAENTTEFSEDKETNVATKEIQSPVLSVPDRELLKILLGNQLKKRIADIFEHK